MKRIRVRPVLPIRDPVTLCFLPEEGAEVDESTFWIRRLADGSVTLLPPETTTKES